MFYGNSDIVITKLNEKAVLLKNRNSFEKALTKHLKHKISLITDKNPETMHNFD